MTKLTALSTEGIRATLPHLTERDAELVTHLLMQLDLTIDVNSMPHSAVIGYLLMAVGWTIHRVPEEDWQQSFEAFVIASVRAAQVYREAHFATTPPAGTS